MDRIEDSTKKGLFVGFIAFILILSAFYMGLSQSRIFYVNKDLGIDIGLHSFHVEVLLKKAGTNVWFLIDDGIFKVNAMTLTNYGKNATRKNCFEETTVVKILYIGLSEAETLTVNSVVQANEITTNGLGRALATFTPLATHGVGNITKVFTFTGTDTFDNVALYAGLSGSNMVAFDDVTPVTGDLGDMAQVRIQETVS